MQRKKIFWMKKKYISIDIFICYAGFLLCILYVHTLHYVIYSKNMLNI